MNSETSHSPMKNIAISKVVINIGVGRSGKPVDFLKRVIAAKGNIIKASSFDDFGNLSIGIHEHIDIPGTRYDPDIGIFGMDVCMALSRPGYRISRKRNKSSIGNSHRIKREDAISFLKQTFGVEVA